MRLHPVNILFFTLALPGFSEYFSLFPRRRWFKL